MKYLIVRAANHTVAEELTFSLMREVEDGKADIYRFDFLSKGYQFLELPKDWSRGELTWKEVER